MRWRGRNLKAVIHLQEIPKEKVSEISLLIFSTESLSTHGKDFSQGKPQRDGPWISYICKNSVKNRTLSTFTSQLLKADYLKHIYVKRLRKSGFKAEKELIVVQNFYVSLSHEPQSQRRCHTRWAISQGSSTVEDELCGNPARVWQATSIRLDKLLLDDWRTVKQ